MPEVGTGTIAIIPDLTAFVKEMRRGVDPAIDRTGKNVDKHIGGAFRSIAKIATGIFVTAGVTRFFGDAIAEAREAAKVGALTENVIKTTGAAANVTAKQVGDLSTRLSNMAGIDDELVQTGANLILTFKNVRNELGEGNKVFDRATAGAIDLSASGFGSVESASVMLGKALNDPIRGITALGRAGVTFTDQQKAQIKVMVEAGDVLGAQKIILQELESQVGGSAAAMADPWDRFGVTIGNLKESIGTALMPVLTGLLSFFMDRLIPGVQSVIRIFSEDGLAGIFTLVREKLGEGIEWMKETGLPWLVETLGEWGSALIDWIKPRIGPLLAKLGDFLEAGAAWMRDVGLPRLWENLQTWGQAFVDWIGPRIGPFLEEVGAFLARITDWMVETGLPELGKKLGEWGSAFVTWIGPRLPGLLLEFGKFMVGLTFWIFTEGVPKLFHAALEMGYAFIKGIAQGVITEHPQLMANIGTLPGDILSALVGIPNLLYQMGRDLIAGFVRGIKDSAGSIGSALSNAVKGAAGVLNPRNLIPGFNVGGLVPGFSTGGTVPGGGPDRDSVLTMLTPGEFVFSRSAVQALGASNLANLHDAARNFNGGGALLPALEHSGGGITVDARVIVNGNAWVDDLDAWANQRDAQLRRELAQAGAIR